ncbi:DNA polymerase III subunit epsilon, partial [Mesorhizobium sp. USDA-HM6]
IANSDHLAGTMIITIAVCAMAEVARPLRFLNLPFGLWLVAAPWLLAGATAGSTLNDAIAGLVVIGLSLPRGRLSKEHYGSWDRYVV